jgi:hypothetical protein
MTCGLASCGGNESSAETEATNATLLNQATVDAILGSDMPQEEQTPPANEAENATGDDEAAAPLNESD